MKHPMLEAVLHEIEIHGEQSTVLDRCQDRTFCECIGVDYQAENVYALIKERVGEYKTQHEVKR